MEESKLKSECYFCENKFSHKMVIFGFDPAQTQICHTKKDANVQAPDVTMIKDGIVPYSLPIGVIRLNKQPTTHVLFPLQFPVSKWTSGILCQN